MTGSRDIDKKHQKCPKNVVFHPFLSPKILSKDQALSIFPNKKPLCLGKLSLPSLMERFKWFFLGFIQLVIELCSTKDLLSKKSHLNPFCILQSTQVCDSESQSKLLKISSSNISGFLVIKFENKFTVLYCFKLIINWDVNSWIQDLLSFWVV